MACAAVGLAAPEATKHLPSGTKVRQMSCAALANILPRGWVAAWLPAGTRPCTWASHSFLAQLSYFRLLRVRQVLLLASKPRSSIWCTFAVSLEGDSLQSSASHGETPAVRAPQNVCSSAPQAARARRTAASAALSPLQLQHAGVSTVYRVYTALDLRLELLFAELPVGIHARNGDLFLVPQCDYDCGVWAVALRGEDS